MSTVATPSSTPSSSPTAPPSALATGGRSGGAFVGVGLLFRLVMRRDRVRLLAWAGGIIALVVLSTASVTALYDTPQELQNYADLVEGNTALVVQAGPGYGLDDPTTGAVLMNELAIWAILAVALMSLFMVVRHTRVEEETGRSELLRAGPVGRHAQMVAALGGVLVANLIVAAGVTLSLLAYDLPAAGTLAFAVSLIAAGMVFAGVGAVGAQVASTARTALGFGGAVIALAWVIRAIGDVNDGTLSWASPIGWAQAIRAFADERWWVLVLPVVATVGLLWGAVALQAHRDFGAGIVEPRAGRPAATPRLASAAALAVRLQRSTVFWWSFGVGLFGGFYGVVSDQAESIVDDNPDVADFLAQSGQASVLDAFLATAMLFVALVATGFTVSSALRARTEELGGRVDPILATPTSRAEWAGGHVAVSVVGSLIVMVVNGILFALGYVLAASDPGRFGELLVASLVMVPAMLVVGGGAFLLWAIRPALGIAGWGLFAAFIAIGLLGPVLDLPDWTLRLSPFDHVPAMPAQSFELLPVVLLTVVAAALYGAGLAALKRRDIA